MMNIVVPCLNSSLTFCCQNPAEANRAHQVIDKEPGTTRWLLETIRSDDFFYDVGANIGTYSLLCGLIQPKCKGIAFEPHSLNSIALIENLKANKMQNRFTVITSPLCSSIQIGPFYYSSLDRGASQNQFNSLCDDLGKALSPEAIEYKMSTTIDHIIYEGGMRAPTLIKIDVDGNELLVLNGMKILLSSPDKPRSIQVEVSPASSSSIKEMLSEFDYQVINQHYTRLGKTMLAGGTDPESVCYNIIFALKGSH